MNMDRGTAVRTIILVIALVNQLLVAFGFEPVPGDETVWYEIISTAFTITTATITWFKNNYITAKGKRQKEVLQRHGLTK